VRFAFIAQHRSAWPTQQMCEALAVSRAGFYEWMGRPESHRARANRSLLAAIRDSFEQSDRTYGSPRVWRDLIAWGHRCSENRVARLMLAAQAPWRHRRAA
jgi:putative transposase